MERSKRNAIIGGIVSAIVLIVMIIGVCVCTTRVPTGSVGVVNNLNGGVTGEVLTQGFHFVAPTKDVTIYSIGLEQSYLTATEKGDSKKDESFSIPTSDGKTVKVDLEFTYRFDADKITKTFTKFKGRDGAEVKETFIKPKVIAWTQEVSAQYPVTDLFGDKRTEINNELNRVLKEKFADYGIIIDSVNFTNIAVDKETEQAIQQKVNAQQANELAKIQADTAKINAEKDAEVARVKAEAKLDVAKIEAEEQKVRAEAEAEANKKIAQSMTDELIEKARVEKWDGKYPQIVGGDTTILKDIEPKK